MMELALERADDGTWRVRVGLVDYTLLGGIRWHNYEFNTEKKARSFLRDWKDKKAENARRANRTWTRIE